MSGKTAVGSIDDGPSVERSADVPTLRTIVATELDGTDPEAIVYRANEGTLDDPTDEWYRYADIDELPARPLDGWDELYVYTESHVYHWVGVGYGSGPERLPRSPESLPTIE